MTLIAQRERVLGVQETSYVQMQSDSYTFSPCDQLSNIDMSDGSTMWVLNGRSDQGNVIYHFIKIMRSGENECLIVEPARLSPAAQINFLSLQICLLERSNALIIKKMQAAQKEESDFLKQATAMLVGLKKDVIAYREVNQNLQRSADHFEEQVDELGKSVIRYKSNVNGLSSDINRLDGQIKGVAQEVKQFRAESCTSGIKYVTTVDNQTVGLDIHSIFNRFVPSALETTSNPSTCLPEQSVMLSKMDGSVHQSVNPLKGSPLSSLPVASSRNESLESVQEVTSEKPVRSQAVPNALAIERGHTQASTMPSSQVSVVQTLPEDPSKTELFFEIKEIILEKEDISLEEKIWEECFNFFEAIFSYLKSLLNPFSSIPK